MLKARCPNGCESTFVVDCEVTSTDTCEVSSTGEVLEVVDSCSQSDHYPFSGSDWECSECGEIAVIEEVEIDEKPKKRKKKKE